MKSKILILILSIIYCACLIVLLVASHYKTPILNQLNSEYYFKEGLFAEAIETEPSKAEYHMLYVLDLIKKNQATDPYMRKFILLQLKQAIELKPYSRVYKKIYNFYAPFLNDGH